MHKTFLALASVVVLGSPERLLSQTPLQLPAFSSIEVTNGAHVIIRPAAAQRVVLVTGTRNLTDVAVSSAGTLVIDRCSVKCPHGYRLEVEIFTPAVAKISLANSGRIQAVGTFTRQRDLTVTVAHGGTLDVRSMPADRVTATVEQGGRILTSARESLSASVTQGGVITYWGNPRTRQAIQHGGAVSRGAAEVLNVPFDDAIDFASHRRK